MPKVWRSEIFSETYLMERPLLNAIRQAKSPVLLIDEVDRADEEFEAFLLEMLSEYQVSIPELGTVTRDIDPACHPDIERDAGIFRRIAPPLSLSLCRLSGCRPRSAHHHGAGQSGRCVACRFRLPIWCKASARKICARCRVWPKHSTGRQPLVGLNVSNLKDDPEAVHETLMCLLKTQRMQRADDTRSDRPVAGEGRMSCCGAPLTPEESAMIDRMMAEKLSAFVATLRDNAFVVGLREAQDAAAHHDTRVCRKARADCVTRSSNCFRPQGRLGKV